MFADYRFYLRDGDGDGENLNFQKRMLNWLILLAKRVDIPVILNWDIPFSLSLCVCVGGVIGESSKVKL